MRDTGLANRIRAKGVDVVEVAGWKERGSDSFAPRGSVNHHTAGASSGTVPSLNTCIYGRPDVPGPLCHVLQSREASGFDKAYVIAAGRANHAGLGGWQGLVGNSSVMGLEVEHIGTTTVPMTRIETAARINAAMLEAPGSSDDAGLTCQHFEWAPTRKIDFNVLGMTPDAFRDRVRYWVGRTVQDQLSPPEEDFVRIVYSPGKPALLWGPGWVQLISASERDALLKIGVDTATVSNEQWQLLINLSERSDALFNARMKKIFDSWAENDRSPLRRAIHAELEQAAGS